MLDVSKSRNDSLSGLPSTLNEAVVVCVSAGCDESAQASAIGARPELTGVVPTVRCNVALAELSREPKVVELVDALRTAIVSVERSTKPVGKAVRASRDACPALT